MGLITAVVSPLFLTATLLGALKHEGAVELKPNNVHNEMVRSTLVRSVAFGEIVYVNLRELWRVATEASKSP